LVQLNFDARNFTPLDNDIIPEGWYRFTIDESSAAPTKDGNPNHTRLVLRFSIMDGPHQGRKVFTGLNIRHTNVRTMEMANREMSAICAAVNMPYVQDTQQIHNIPLWGRVKIRKDPNGVYDDQAEIRSYKPINFVPPGLVGAQPVAPVATAPQGWQQPPQQPVYQQPMAPQQPAPYYQPPQQPVPQQQNGGYGPQGWQQPAASQPWQQPAAPPPQQPAAQTWQQQPQPQPQQPQPQPPVEPQPQPPQQPAPTGFAAPPPQQPAPQQTQAPANPAATAAQSAEPPWARRPGS